MTATTATTATNLPKNYDPAAVESRLYAWWESQGYFQPSEDLGATPFVITIPPPNVTGELHLGHALTYTIEDVLGRYARMNGYATLIVPGADHASIAVHSKVEAMLAEEGIRRRDEIGRDAFVRRAWEWKEKYGSEIREQFRVLGESFDWSRERFTMDPDYQRAVVTMFVRLYDEGHIYRGARVINWCPGCRTGISDIEVRQEQRDDTLYFVRLPFAGGEGDIVVATVRPETMYGDVAVAVHPEDTRYAAAVGRRVHHPLTNHDIPVIADEFVERDFGSGAVKITPAHDYADFEVGERHNLPMPVVITPEGTMAPEVGEPCAGLPVDEARARTVSTLEAGGFIVRTQPLTHSVPVCDRCGTAIEPLLSEQWFMRMKELAQPAIDAVRSGKVRFVPERWTRIYLEWMENIRPWNISRQLWWGQRIPIYHCENGHPRASVTAPERCDECASITFIQDPDVLDTWFSSALWPFAALGWPRQTDSLRRFYPTSFMNTSSQILYLWIARMIMMGIHFLGREPFPVVLINPTILNEKGQRMSKSLGTGIDPRDAVARYGADATRFGVLSAGSFMQQEIRIAGYDKADEGRRFANKIWNVARFVLSALEKAASPATPDLDRDLADRWILSRLNACLATVTESMETYDMSIGLRALHEFFWSEFADWYVEMAKPSMYGEDVARRAATSAVLWSVLERSLRALHPFMPFLTEEVWQRLRVQPPPQALRLSGLATVAESIMLAPWPVAGERDLLAERDIETVKAAVTALRNVRAEHGVEPARRLSATAVAGGHGPLLEQTRTIIESLAGLEELVVVENRLVDEPSAEALAGSISITVPLRQLKDVAGEITRAGRELDKKEQMREGKRALLDNAEFRAKAPENVVASTAREVAELDSAIAKLRAHLASLTGSQ